MVIFMQHGIRVIQHEYLQLFNVQKWMEGDDPRSYGRKYDYFTVEQTKSIDRVNELVRELIEESV